MQLLSFRPEIELPVTLILVAPVVVVSFLFYMLRWAGRRSTEVRAGKWPIVEARVNSSYELDENQTILSTEFWLQSHGEEEDTQRDYIPSWQPAIQYSYRVAGEIYAGTYFLPQTYTDGYLASEAGKFWIGKTINVRYNPARPGQSLFLVKDGAPGRSRVSRLGSDKPYVTQISLN